MFKIDKKYLPSKNFTTALSIAIGAILIVIAINYLKTNTTKFTNNNISGITASSTVMQIDTDGDSLPDWKEYLYGTNPRKADTDGDGTNDANEIAQDRDPLKANTAGAGQEPNDKISAKLVEENKKLIEDYQKLNETDKFSRDLFSNIIASQPINGSMSKESMDSIVNQAMSELPNKNYTGVTKIEDLNLLKTDAASIPKNGGEYIKNFYTEVNKLKSILFTDIQYMNSYVTNGDTKSKTELLKIADSYQEIVNNLIKMQVPVAIGYYDINYHLALINELEILIAIDRDVASSPKDSLGIFANIAVYNGTVEEMIQTLTLIDSVLSSKN